MTTVMTCEMDNFSHVTLHTRGTSKTMLRLSPVSHTVHHTATPDTNYTPGQRYNGYCDAEMEDAMVHRDSGVNVSYDAETCDRDVHHSPGGGVGKRYNYEEEPQWSLAGSDSDEQARFNAARILMQVRACVFSIG